MSEEQNLDLTIYDKMPNPLEAIKFLGNLIAKSRMFGCETPEQGQILAWECLVRRVAPLSLKETYHLINTGQGASLTMRADAMLAGFLVRGGKSTVIQRDQFAAIVDLTTVDGHTSRFTCTIEDAIAAGYLDPGEAAKKKGVEEKANWDAPRKKTQMLWARVISDGVRAVDPRVCAGRYVPEDFGVSSEIEIPEVPSPEDESESAEDVPFTVETVASAPVVTEAVAATKPPKASRAKAATVSSSVPDQPADPPADAAGTITAPQRNRIEELYEHLAVKPEVRAKALEKRHANSLRNLSTEQAGEILATLEAKAKQLQIQQESAAIAGESNLPDAATEALLTGPCSSEQVAKAKLLIVELQQQLPDAKVSASIKAKLTSASMNTLADLTMGDMDRLLQSLGAKSIEKWVESELAKPRCDVAPTGESPSGN